VDVTNDPPGLSKSLNTHALIGEHGLADTNPLILIEVCVMIVILFTILGVPVHLHWTGLLPSKSMLQVFDRLLLEAHMLDKLGHTTSLHDGPV
jgi:hypothetical protein